MKNDELMHVGTPHMGAVPHSGRYPYGSGEHGYQRDNSFLGQYHYYKKSGAFANDTEIARAMGMSSKEFREKRAVANAEKRAADRAKAIELLNKQRNSGMGKVNISAIAREMYGDPKKESSVRALLDDTLNSRSQRIQNTADMLKKLRDMGTTVLVVTHDTELIRHCCSRMISESSFQ